MYEVFGTVMKTHYRTAVYELWGILLGYREEVGKDLGMIGEEALVNSEEGCLHLQND
jgi:hypothetical protein